MPELQTLYLIVTRQYPASPSELSLVRAAEALGLRAELLISEQTALDDLAVMEFPDNSLLYRVRVDAHAAALEAALLALHPGKFTSVFYARQTLGRTQRYAATINEIAAGLPIIPSAIIDGTWASQDDTWYEQKVAALGGWPIVCKTLNLSHGQGVEKFDDLAGLRTRVEEIIATSKSALLRKYLADYRHFRLVVVDYKVIAAIEYHKPSDDFRTNAMEFPEVTSLEVAEIDPRIIEIAELAAETAYNLLAGVDVLLDLETDTPYLAETNTPCNFSRAEEPTGIDIASQIITALQHKAAAGK